MSVDELSWNPKSFVHEGSRLKYGFLLFLGALEWLFSAMSTNSNQSSFFYLNVYLSDLTPFNGILTADRDVVTENQNYKLYTAAIRSDFDDVAWTNHTDWKRTIDFDNEV